PTVVRDGASQTTPSDLRGVTPNITTVVSSSQSSSSSGPDRGAVSALAALVSIRVPIEQQQQLPSDASTSHPSASVHASKSLGSPTFSPVRRALSERGGLASGRSPLRRVLFSGLRGEAAIGGSDDDHPMWLLEGRPLTSSPTKRAYSASQRAHHTGLDYDDD